jgi:23S rRNA pseudouridine2604 synthase
MSNSGKTFNAGEQGSAGSSDDPWAKWRKSGSGDIEATVGTPAAAAAPTEKPAAMPPAPIASEAEPASRTLSVRKPERKSVAAPARPGGKKPFSSNNPPSERPPRPKQTREAASPWGQTGRVAPPGEKKAAMERSTVRSSAIPTTPNPDGVRLSKVMSERGLCSRREADLWIERGWVYVDGTQIVELGSRIKPDAEITVSREAKETQAKQFTILINKPVGYVSGQPEPGCVPAVTLISTETQWQQSGDPAFKPWMLRGLAPAGRLDVDSTGLLVLTQDGRVAKKLVGEDSDVEKEYLVRVEGQMIPGGLKLLSHGLELDGKPLRTAWVKQLNEDQLHFILKEGKKRQIRRMCELVGLHVIGLKRVRIGRVKLGKLPIGQWRFLRADEAF